MAASSRSSADSSILPPAARPAVGAQLAALSGAGAVLLLLLALLLLFAPLPVAHTVALGAPDPGEIGQRVLALAALLAALAVLLAASMKHARAAAAPSTAEVSESAAMEPADEAATLLPGSALWDAHQALRVASVFRDARSEVLAMLAAQAVRAEYQPGEVIFHQGEPGDGVLIIASGQVDVLVAKPRQPLALVATLGAGSCVGEMAALFTGRPRSATVRVRQRLVGYALSTAALRTATREDPQLAARLGGRIAQLDVDAFLKLSSPFARLPSAAIWELAGRMHRRPVQAGEVIVRQGEPGDLFYLVRNGQLEVTRADAGPEEQRPPLRVARLGPGDCFGEAALLTDRPRSATVTAATEGELLELSRADFQAVVQRYQSVAAFFRELFFARYNAAPGQLLAVPDPLSTLMPSLKRRQTRRVLAWFAGGALLLAALSILAVATRLVPFTYATLLVGGLLPAATYAAYMRERALLGPPLRGLLLVSALAALAGVPLAVSLEGYAARASIIPPPLVAALVEEPAKLAAVLWVMRARRFRFGLDGVIFGVAAAMGFGGLESVGYGLLGLRSPVVTCGVPDEALCLVQTLWLRIAAVFLGHGPWTAIVCATLWRARGRTGRTLTRSVLLAFALAVGLHTLWDTNPILLGPLVAVCGLVALRHLMQEGLLHQAAALNAVLLPRAEPGDSAPAYTVECGSCGSRNPSRAMYCARCYLALA